MEERFYRTIKMAVTFFRLKIKTSTLAKAQSIKTNMQNSVLLSDINQTLGYKEVKAYYDDVNNEYVIRLVMFPKDDTALTKYKNFFQGKIDTLQANYDINDVDRVVALKITYVNNCTHDEPNPQPCVESTLVDWSE